VAQRSALHFFLVLCGVALGCGGTTNIAGTGSGGTHTGTTASAGGSSGGMVCQSDLDCPPSEKCDTTRGFCFFAGCLYDSDCSLGKLCDTATGKCTGTTEVTCHECACTQLLSMGGCADLCDSAQNGTTTPNFCNGVPALPQCAKCLVDLCAGITNGPIPNDPAACQ
jgi:hypothetical protein